MREQRSVAAGLPILLLWMLLCGRSAAAPVEDQTAFPLADVHTHYKWSQVEVTSAEQAAAILQDNNVELAVVIGLPARYALRLAEAAPTIAVPIWSPYQLPGDWSRWAQDEGVLQRARQALAGGDYRGIGELHLIGGFTPAWNTPVIRGLFHLAAEFEVPVLLHTELSRVDYLTGLCAAYPNTRILWAHAGAILTVEQVDHVLRECPNLWAELSARDPWRFVKHPITNTQGELLPAWRELLLRWPSRFMIGTDTVWPVHQLDSWDQADTGWQEYARFIDFHRGWLQHLPAAEALAIGRNNALKFFGKSRPAIEQ